MLAGALLLGLVHVGAQSFSYTGQVGNAYTAGARDGGLADIGASMYLFDRVVFLPLYALGIRSCARSSDRSR